MVIDGDDANKVLHLVFKIMEGIFTGTIKRYMGSEESVVTVATSDNGGKANLSHTTGIEEQTQSTISGLACRAKKTAKSYQYFFNAV